MAEKRNQVGQVTGLAWTEVGGELLTIEAALMPGKGKVQTYRKTGRGDAGIDSGGSDRGSESLSETWHPRRVFRQEGYPHPPSGRRHSKDGPSAGVP